MHKLGATNSPSRNSVSRPDLHHVGGALDATNFPAAVVNWGGDRKLTVWSPKFPKNNGQPETIKH